MESSYRLRPRAVPSVLPVTPGLSRTAFSRFVDGAPEGSRLRADLIDGHWQLSWSSKPAGTGTRERMGELKKRRLKAAWGLAQAQSLLKIDEPFDFDPAREITKQALQDFLGRHEAVPGLPAGLQVKRRSDGLQVDGRARIHEVRGPGGQALPLDALVVQAVRNDARPESAPDPKAVRERFDEAANRFRRIQVGRMPSGRVLQVITSLLQPEVLGLFLQPALETSRGRPFLPVQSPPLTFQQDDRSRVRPIEPIGEPEDILESAIITIDDSGHGGVQVDVTMVVHFNAVADPDEPDEAQPLTPDGRASLQQRVSFCLHIPYEVDPAVPQLQWDDEPHVVFTGWLGPAAPQQPVVDPAAQGSRHTMRSTSEPSRAQPQEGRRVRFAETSPARPRPWLQALPEEPETSSEAAD